MKYPSSLLNIISPSVSAANGYGRRKPIPNDRAIKIKLFPNETAANSVGLSALP
jgi:hypothetical protein